MWTENGVSIRERVANEQTQFCKTQKEAAEVARQKRSYFYQVFDIKNEHIGYAVPN